MTWNPKTYLTFADQRTRPAAELLGRVPAENPGRVIDLGCGPGNSTALLRARWPKAGIEGLDSSPEMLAEARQSGVDANWVLADLANWSPDKPYDVIFSNATFQWVPGQAALFPRLMSFLKPGGVFAFQVPVNNDAPSHALIRQVAAEPLWKDLLNVREIERGKAGTYYDILIPQAAVLDIWQTEYLQVLEGEDAVYRWVSGTSLRPYLKALNDEPDRGMFIAAYKAKLNAAYPRRPDGTTLFPFQRLFVVAQKA